MRPMTTTGAGIAALALVVVLFTLGCGGSSNGIDKSRLEQAIKTDAAKQYQVPIDSVLCAKLSTWHFTCMVNAGANGSMGADVQCDSTGACVWRYGQ